MMCISCEEQAENISRKFSIVTSVDVKIYDIKIKLAFICMKMKLANETCLQQHLSRNVLEPKTTTNF